MSISRTVTYHVRGEVVLDTVRQDLVGSVPASTKDDTGDRVVGGDSTSPRHLNIVLLHCHGTNLQIQTSVKTISDSVGRPTLFLLTMSLKSSLSMK